jgi:hypothetical protein
MKARDLSIGMVFGKWTTTSGAVCRLEDQRKGEDGKQVLVYVECQCACGSPRKLLTLNSLSRGKTNSCGCYSNNAQIKKFYRIAGSAYDRCYNPKNKRYPRYGGRGITVEFASRGEFADYIKELPGYTLGMSLDRIDNDGNYARNNLRWASHSEQNTNKGMMVTNKSGIKYLSRGRTGSGGWRVQIARNGQVTCKSFSDSKFGGEEESKQAAIAFIEEQLKMCQN